MWLQPPSFPKSRNKTIWPNFSVNDGSCFWLKKQVHQRLPPFKSFNKWRILKVPFQGDKLVIFSEFFGLGYWLHQSLGGFLSGSLLRLKFQNSRIHRFFISTVAGSEMDNSWNVSRKASKNAWKYPLPLAHQEVCLCPASPVPLGMVGCVIMPHNLLLSSTGYHSVTALKPDQAPKLRR